MATPVLTKQYVLDTSGQPIGVILPIEEYRALLAGEKRSEKAQTVAETAPASLYGALRHLKGAVASTEEIDEARRELWSAWDRSEAP